MNRLRALLRWILRGERNVTNTLDSLSDEIRELRSRIDDFTASASRPDPPTPAPDPWLIAAERSSLGVNVVGYLQHQLSLGDSGRRMCELLVAAELSTSPIAFTATSSPLLPRAFATTQRIDQANTIAVVAADQLPVLKYDHPEIFDASDRMIGYCFWELSTLSAAGAVGAELVDEIWACTTFIADAFERLGTVPVRRVPITIAEPQPSARDRESFAPFANAGDRCVVGVTFDHFSVMERKNPLAAIESFTRSFAPDSGPLMIVKTLNADLHREAHAELYAATKGRSDIVVWDEHLDRPDQFAFISHLDVLVSLHRGEGLGVHLAEAMWLGVPVVATGYSGNVDFMDDTCARLVGHTMTPVRDGGVIYPDGAEWAEPDVGHASEILATLVADADLRTSIGEAARARMLSQPDDATVGRDIAAALGLG